MFTLCSNAPDDFHLSKISCSKDGKFNCVNSLYLAAIKSRKSVLKTKKRAKLLIYGDNLRVSSKTKHLFIEAAPRLNNLFMRRIYSRALSFPQSSSFGTIYGFIQRAGANVFLPK